ncbi:MAG: pilus assembly protein [Oscillospiraceae bacterium]|nr:pilus assembly protein [Oscillospiraceae bacterium]
MKKLKDEKGAMVIMEATIVFPVMFLVIFLLVFMGNAYYQKSRVQAIVTTLALKGAAFSGDPMLKYVSETGSVPAFGSAEADIKPYRYFNFTNFRSDIKSYVSGELNTSVGKIGTGLFSGMKPRCTNVKVDTKNYFIYGTFSVDVDFEIPLPIRLMGMTSNFKIEQSARADMPVSDVPEFMRNINLVDDVLDQTGVKGKINEWIDKVKGLFKADSKE